VGQGLRGKFPVVLRPEGAGATGDLAWQSWGRFGRSIGRRCRRADAIVSISEAIRTELLGAGFDPQRIHSLPNGVPVPTTSWRPRPGWQPAPRAVFVGRLAPEKGLDTLVDAWPGVLARHPKARLTLLGEGPERARLEGQVERLGLNGAVELPGATADPGALLREADLFVLPSREEGMSIALLEAMALGVPLVASAIPGNQHLVQDQALGRLAPPGDPDALGRAILEQWADLDRAASMGRAARRRVAEEYSIAAVARKHMELFQELLGEREAHAE
jgi:glycosyltransferase involved in cell wall biosynthesis